MNRRVIFDRLIVGGLHKDDFEWAFEQYQDAGYVLICFGLDSDGYHWKAVYVKASAVEKLLGEGGVPSDRLCLCTCDARRQ
jgi:hypothetical protein